MAITLFENITEQLTDLEINNIVPIIVNVLKLTNSENRYTEIKISKFIKLNGLHTSPARFRKCISYIRQKNLIQDRVIIGASNGYYLTNSIKDIDLQIESIQGRIDSQKAIVDSLYAQRQNLINLSK